MTTREPIATGTAVAMRAAAPLDHPRSFPQVLDFSQGTLVEKYQLAEMLSRSDLVPEAFRGKPGNILIAADLGASVGFTTAQALQTIAVINGRPTIWGDGMMALVMQSPLCLEYTEVEVGTLGKDDYGWRATAKRLGKNEPYTNTFTIADAKRAGLFTKKGPWQDYGPNRMCKMRARSWTCRDAFPDVLKGLQMREEVIDMEPIDGAAREAISQAATRTEALKFALLHAKKPDPTDPEPTPEPVDQSSDPPMPPEERISLALANLAANDPDFYKIDNAAIRRHVNAEAIAFGWTPWDLKEMERSAGGLKRKNAAEILRTIRERAMRAQLGAPAGHVVDDPPIDPDELIPDESPDQEYEAPAAARDEDANAHIEGVKPIDAQPVTYDKMTTEQLLAHVDDRAHSLGLTSGMVGLMLRAHAEGGLTAENIPAVIAAIEKKAAAK